MRNLLLTIFLATIIQDAQAQHPKESDYWRSLKYDTATYKQQTDLLRKLSLPDLIKAKDSSHFRYWPGKHANCCVIDIWTNDFINFSGVYKVYIFEYQASNTRHKRSAQAFYRNYGISDDTAKIIYSLLNALNEIPDGDSIPKWNDQIIDDGYADKIEWATIETFNSKFWNNPSAKVSISQYAGDIVRISEQIYGLINWEGKCRSLIDQLPAGSYRYGRGVTTKLKKGLTY